MDTKTKGDIAEHAVILRALKEGWGVAKPVGDRLPYDLIFDVRGALLRVQVKSAWLHRSSMNFVVDNRRTKSNRRVILRDRYKPGDFDFAVLYAESPDMFWVMPFDVFDSYAGGIHLVVTSDKRQRPPKSDGYLGALHLIADMATQKVAGSNPAGATIS